MKNDIINAIFRTIVRSQKSNIILLLFIETPISKELKKGKKIEFQRKIESSNKSHGSRLKFNYSAVNLKIV